MNSSLGTCGDGDERVDFSFGGSRCLYKWLYLVVFPLWAVVGITVAIGEPNELNDIWEC